jgi:hypothetical protein
LSLKTDIIFLFKEEINEKIIKKKSISKSKREIGEGEDPNPTTTFFTLDHPLLAH